jgi:hypothetical protein
VRSIVREVAGFSPYERRVLELLRNSKVRDLFCLIGCVLLTNLQDKKARKLTKKRVRGDTLMILQGILIGFHYSSVPFFVRNASWRNYLRSSRKAGGHIRKEYDADSVVV